MTEFHGQYAAFALPKLRGGHWRGRKYIIALFRIVGLFYRRPTRSFPVERVRMGTPIAGVSQAHGVRA
jgi:hypothetical protein